MIASPAPTPPTDDEVIRFCAKAIPLPARRAILACVRAGYGEARDLPAIVATARAHWARPRVVAAAFLFLPQLYDRSRYLDCLDIEADDAAYLPNVVPVYAAFALGQLGALGLPLVSVAYLID